MLVIDKEAVPEYIIQHITDNLKEANIINEDDFYDEKHTAIDDWVSGSTGEAKSIVDDYGVLTAIKLYKQNCGEINLDYDDDKIYLTLAYNIISEWFNEYYSYEQLNE